MIPVMPVNARDRHRRGQEAEAAARAYLEAQGCRVILQNFRCRMGELDLVVIDRRVLAIVEVRQRSATSYVSARESVVPRKQQRIIRATRYLLLTQHQLRQYPVRFDVVALDVDKLDNTAHLTWVRHAFSA